MEARTNYWDSLLKKAGELAKRAKKNPGTTDLRMNNLILEIANAMNEKKEE